ncbi:MAG TPA: endonuclease/exonuclease/phosphatase family protein [Blastocatellia bacterium]
MGPTYEDAGGEPQNNRHLVDELRRFATIDDLRRSDFYRARKTELSRLLDEPKIYESPEASPRLRSFLRIVEWNIERGAKLEGIIGILNNHPVLGYADLLLLNELDSGMVRSGNRNVPLELGGALSAHAIYVAEYLELTKGVGEELNLPGENQSALHGNAILTRHAFSKVEVAGLPRCEDNFASREKRLGGRKGILVEIDVNGTGLLAANAHLDVVNSPRCRGRQLRALLEAIERRAKENPARPIIVGGDFNTHTFARGGRLRTLKNTGIILGSNRERLVRRLSRPESREPALRHLAGFGYSIEEFNDRLSTARTMVSSLEDSNRLPGPVRWWANRRIGPGGLLLEFRLDWLAARGLRPLADGEVVDEQTGVASIAPRTFQGFALSDHDPIVVDVWSSGQ